MKMINKNALAMKGKNSIDWKKSIGLNIDFQYDDICGTFQIVKHFPSKHKVAILYKNIEYEINTSLLIKCKLGAIIGKVLIGIYKYNIADIITTKTGSKIQILKQLMLKSTHSNAKAYQYICLKDGYVGNIFETDLVKGQGCPVCVNKKVKIGINDMWTTNPELAKLLANPEDGYKYTQSSSKRTDWICSNCNNIISNKPIQDINSQGLSCPKCSDGISYPEKVVYNILLQLNVDCLCQYSKLNADWISNQTRYDFAILNKLCIIEVHGMEHYAIGFNTKHGKSLKEIQENDIIKGQLAKNNGIKNYIIIDARYSNINYIKNSILHSKLDSLFDLSSINWELADKESHNSMVKYVCNLWNNGVRSVKEIEDYIKIVKKNCIIKYLKIGTKYGWCDYNPNKQHGKKIICLNTHKIFEQIIDASNLYNLNSSLIIKCCKNNKINIISTYGRHPITGEKLSWMYYKDYLSQKQAS